MNNASLITSIHKMLATGFGLACSLVYAGTEGYLTTSTAAGSSEVGPTAMFAGQDATQSGINAREAARRTAERDAAMQLLEEGRQAYSEGKYSVALEKYRQAWDKLPHAPATRKLQEYIRSCISDASIAVAMEYAKVGRYDDAEQLLLDVLSREPDNARARKELSLLRDPVRNNPALTPEHVKNVDEVSRLLQLGYGYYDLGQFNQAYDTFNAVLRIDPYNEAARRGQEAVSKRRSHYYRAAYDSYRSKALAEVDAAWQEDVPSLEDNSAAFAPTSRGRVEQTEKQIKINNALDNVRVPQVNFDKTPISEVVDILRGVLRKNGEGSLNINYRAPAPAPVAVAAPAASDDGEDDDEEGSDDEGEEGESEGAAAAPAPVAAGPVPEPEVTLSLSDVTLRELLQEICSNAECVFNVSDRGINIYMANDPSSKVLEQRVWRNVPLSFIQGSGEEEEEGGDEEEDAFASGSKGGKQKVDAKKELKRQGICMFESKKANAWYSRRLQQLTVYSTTDDLDSVEDALLEFQEAQPQMIKVTTKFVEVTQQNDEELSFDWVVNPFSVSNNGTTFLGGVTGANSTPTRTYKDFVTSPGAGYGNNHHNNGSWPVTNNSNFASDTDPVTQGLVTGGLRSGNGAISSSNMDSLLTGGSPAATSTDNAHVAPGILSLSGIYDSGSFQMIMRGLSQKQGVDMMNAPSLVITPAEEVLESPEDPDVQSPITHEGDARIEIVRRFVYPTGYTEPQIPDQGGSSIGSSTNVTMSVPVAAPSNPDDWGVQEVGLIMAIKVDEAPRNNIIKFSRFIVRIVDFEGFVNYGSPIVSGVATNNVVEQIVLTENRIDQPVFGRKLINTRLSLFDGHTVAIGGMIEDQVQKVEDKVPVFGDLPLIGRFFRSNAESHIRKNLTVFVTADIIDAAGKPVRNRSVEETPAGNAVAPGLFPEDGLVNP